MARTMIFNTIKEIESEGIAYIYANNSTAKAIINLDKGLMAEIKNKRTFTHNQTSNYFAYTRLNENLHDLVMAFYIGEGNLTKGQDILKKYKSENYQVDHFRNTNRTEEETRFDNRIQNLHLVPQGENKANYSQFYQLPYEFHSEMIEGYFASYMTDGIYEAWKVYEKFSAYLADRNCFYSNGLTEVLKIGIKTLKEEPESEYKNSQLGAIRSIIQDGNIRAETNHKQSLKLLDEYGIILKENETRMLPDGHVLSNIDISSPKALKEIQLEYFVLVNDNPMIRKRLIQIIKDMYSIKEGKCL